ncbi:hypothetical protein ILUMI_10737, partial [Ignelater luminosus]
MFKYFIIICLFVINLSLEQKGGTDVDYCKLKCKDKDHFICQLKHKCEKAPGCKKFKDLKLSEKEKQEIVDIHNKWRNDIALGKKPCKSKDGKDFPKAAAMNELVWDKELEFQALCWANQCKTKGDPCRVISDGKLPAGQNIAWSKSKSVSDLLKEFHSDCKKTTLAQIKTFKASGKSATSDRFTQFIWWESSKIGCARTEYEYPKKDVMAHLTCNYAKSGNEEGKPVYPEGEPCKKCSKGTKCHAELKGLCATKPSKSEYPNICKFAKQKKECVPFLDLTKSKETSATKKDEKEKKEPAKGDKSTTKNAVSGRKGPKQTGANERESEGEECRETRIVVYDSK